MTTQPNEPATTSCRCGDYDCSEFRPKNQDRSQCCQYCGYYDCDVCGWTDPARNTSDDEEVPW